MAYLVFSVLVVIWMSFGSKADDCSKAIPFTSSDDLKTAFREYVNSAENAKLFELGEYKSLDDQKAPRPNDILEFKTLLVHFFSLEKRGKFKPTVMADVLHDIVHEFSMRPLNKSSFCHKAWSRFIVKQLGVMIRHARQIAECDEDLTRTLNNVTGGDDDKKGRRPKYKS